MKREKRDYHARLIIYGLDSQITNLKVVTWLKSTIKELEKNRKKENCYAKIFTARLMK